MSPNRPSPRLQGALAALLLAGLVAAACPRAATGPPEDPEAGRPAVRAVASIPPLAWFVERLGGDRVVVETFLPPGASPHAFEPAPRQVTGLHDADLVVVVGHPDLPFEHRHLERLARRRPAVELVRFLEDGAGGGTADDSAGHHHGDGPDPHVWVAPDRALPAARRIAAALTRLDPAGAEVYRAHLDALEAEMGAVDRYLHGRLDGLPRRTFVVQHPSWGHLAEAYGLEQLAIEEEGKEPSPQRLVALIDRLRQQDVGVVFVQPTVSPAAAEALAAEIGARVEVLDPLARDWAANLRSVADTLHDALDEGALDDGALDDGAPDGGVVDGGATGGGAPAEGPG